MYINDFTKIQLIMNNLDIELSGCGHVKGDSLWNTGYVSRCYNRMYFILNGSIRLVEKESQKEYILIPGNVYLIPCDTSFSFECSDNMEKIFIHFNFNLINGYDIFHFVDEVIGIPEDIAFINNFKNDFYNNNFFSTIYYKHYVYSIILKYIEMTQLELNSDIKLEYSDFIIKIFNYIRENLSAELEVNDISNEFNISRVTLNKRFKEEVGTSVKRYIDTMVGIEAKRLLSNPNNNIKEVAYLLKFQDPYNFSKFFKRVHNTSPSLYKNGYKHQI